MFLNSWYNVPRYCLHSLTSQILVCHSPDLFALATRSPGILVHRTLLYFSHLCLIVLISSFMFGTPLYKISRQDPFISLVLHSFFLVLIFHSLVYEKLLNCSHQFFGIFSTQESSRFFLERQKYLCRRTSLRSYADSNNPITVSTRLLISFHYHWDQFNAHTPNTSINTRLSTMAGTRRTPLRDATPTCTSLRQREKKKAKSTAEVLGTVTEDVVDVDIDDSIIPPPPVPVRVCNAETTIDTTAGKTYDTTADNTNNTYKDATAASNVSMDNR